jgi:hypothetical protein
LKLLQPQQIHNPDPRLNALLEVVQRHPPEMRHLDPLFANSVDAAVLLYVGLYLQGEDLDLVPQLNPQDLFQVPQPNHGLVKILQVNQQSPAEMEHPDSLFVNSVTILLHVGLKLAQTQDINLDLLTLVDATRS